MSITDKVIESFPSQLFTYRELSSVLGGVGLFLLLEKATGIPLIDLITFGQLSNFVNLIIFFAVAYIIGKLMLYFTALIIYISLAVINWREWYEKRLNDQLENSKGSDYIKYLDKINPVEVVKYRQDYELVSKIYSRIVNEQVFIRVIFVYFVYLTVFESAGFIFAVFLSIAIFVYYDFRLIRMRRDIEQQVLEKELKSGSGGTFLDKEVDLNIEM